MNISRYTIGAAVTAVAFSVLAACSSAPPKPNVDFSPNHDFNSDKKIGFYALSGRTTGDNATVSTLR